MGRSNASSRLATTGLVGLVALNVVLVALALRSNHTSGIETSPSSTATSSIDSSGSLQSPSPTTSTPSATSSATATTATTPLQIMLVAIDDQRAWRVHVGSCSAGGATLATTNDGGRTWADAKAPLRTIVRVRPTDGQAAFVVGADVRCLAELKSTTDGGAAWASTSPVGGAWFRDPKNPQVVWAPGASRSQPCAGLAVLDLAVVSQSSARVLCADGLVRSTTNAGSSWHDSGEVTGAVALAVLSTDPAQTYVVRLDVPDCAGIQVERVDQSAATSCVQTAMPHDPGQIALSLVKGGGWLSVGDTTMRSTDGLATWTAF